MRHIATSAGGGAERTTNLVLIDGVKVVEAPSRWALVIPYPDEPMCRVWAQGPTPSAAEQTAERYAHAVTEVVEGEVHTS
jgi:mannose-1-phosphate guanylyltransferase/phosphomannomutase